MQNDSLVQLAVSALEDLKGADITTIDVRDKTGRPVWAGWRRR